MTTPSTNNWAATTRDPSPEAPNTGPATNVLIASPASLGAAKQSSGEVQASPTLHPLAQSSSTVKHLSPASPPAKTSAEKQSASITKPSSPTHLPATESCQALSPAPHSTNKPPTDKAPIVTKHPSDIPAKVPTKEPSPNPSTAEISLVAPAAKHQTWEVFSPHSPDYPMYPSNFTSATSHLNQTH